MSRTERIDNPSAIEASRIDHLIASGVRPVIQFSGPDVGEEILDAVNALCARHGDAVDVRFYGFYSQPFDGRLLRRIPAVGSLLLDCLQSAEHVEEVLSLEHLTALSLGIFELDAPDLLAADSFARLRKLSLGPTRRGNISLRPVATMAQLRELHTSQETDLDAVGDCGRLHWLQLGSIGRKTRLDFLGRLSALETLRLIVGGRDDLGELRLERLRELAIIRVRGFSSLDPDRFPGLETLHIEDQIRLESIDFSERSARLEKFLLLNCKGLERITGLRRLASLRELRISLTALDVDALVSGGLPPSLKTFAFFTAKKTSNAAIRKKLERLGFAE